MATVKYDHYNRREKEILYLATPDRRILCALNGLDEKSVSVTRNANNTHKINFDIYKNIDDDISNCYEYIEEGMQVYIDDTWYQINNAPTINFDGIKEYKSLECESYEITLQQYDLVNFMINTASPGSYDLEYNKKHNSSTGDEDGIDYSSYIQIQFYNETNPDISLVNLMLKHANVPRWKIGYVDNTILSSQVSGLTTNKPLAEEIYYFEESSIDVYSYITQKLSQAYRCVPIFDTKNYLIHFFRIETIGNDTNICIGFRNVENNISISRTNPLFTHFSVKGGDGLDSIAAVNLGSDDVYDISYFARYPFMPLDLVNKYDAWIQYRDSRRSEYIELSREYNTSLNIVTDLKYRVPSDSVTTDYTSLSVDDLQTAYNDNVLLIIGIESGYIDEYGNFDLTVLQNSSDWELYSSIMNYTLPSIVSALQLKDSEPALNPDLSDIIEDESYESGRFVQADYGKGNLIANVNPVIMNESWTAFPSGITAETFELTDSPCYGITRALSVFNSSAVSNRSYGYFQKQIHVIEGSNYCLSAYVRPAENISTINLEYGTANAERTVVTFDITGNSWQRIYYVFTAESPMVDIAFSANSTSSGLSSFDLCGMQLEIGESPTQFGFFIQNETIVESYETNWSSFGTEELSIKLETYEQQIKILEENGFADSWGSYSDVEEDYHNQMYQKYMDYKRLYDDCNDALEERAQELSAAEEHLDAINQSRITIATETDIATFGDVQSVYTGFTDDEIDLIRSFYIHRDYSNDNIITTSIDDENAIIDKQIQLYEDALDVLYAESHPQWTYSGDYENLLSLSEYRDFSQEMDLWNFIRIETQAGKFVKLRLISMTYNPCIWDSELTVEFSSMIQYKFKRDDFATLLDSIQSSSKNTQGSIGSSTSNETLTITADVVRALLKNPAMQNAISVGSINATSGRIENISAGTVTADVIVAELLKADQAQIDRLSAVLISADKVVSAMLTADDATIHKLLASKISVGDLLAHDATAEIITLISKDGNPSIAFKDSTQQFYDSEGNIRVQIGQDGNGDFNFVVVGEDGSTALFDSTGITKAGIPDNTIINDMLEDKTINKEKLGFEIIEPNEHGGIDISQIYDGEGGLFGADYTSFKESVSNSVETLDSKIDNTATYTLYIETPNGCHMLPSGITMTARLFKNSVDVTDEWDDSYFIWTRQSNDSYGDLYWNDQHSTGTKTLLLTSDDVNKSASFQCKFETEETVVYSD